MFEIFYKLFDGYWGKGMLEIKKAYGVEKDWKKKRCGVEKCRKRVLLKNIGKEYYLGVGKKNGVNNYKALNNNNR